VGGGEYFSIPIGSIVPYIINNDLPDGFLICNGAAISREEYLDLFEKIGTIYGVGDGSTTFNLPDLRDRFLEGNTTAGTSIAAGLPDITGVFQLGDTTRSLGMWYGSGSFQPLDTTSGDVAQYNSNHNVTARIMNFKASLSNSIYGNSTTVQPPAFTVIYLIKALKSNLSPINIQSPYNTRKIITTSGTWTAPLDGWYKFTLKGGGGGCGAAYDTSSTYYLGGGGGEGGTTFAYEYMHEGDTATITIGAGGKSKQYRTVISNLENGESGGNTTVIINNNLYSAGGGEGGNHYNNIHGCRGGTGDIPGISGEICRFINNYNTYGGGHDAGFYGNSNSAGAIGYGAGGGGYYASLDGNGGNGRSGVVWIEYFNPNL
jgi:microcystin-dependent protein